MGAVHKNSPAEWQKRSAAASLAVAGASGPFLRPVLLEVLKSIVDCAWMAFQWVAFRGVQFLDLEAQGAMAMAMAQEGQASSPSLEAMDFLLVLGELE